MVVLFFINITFNQMTVAELIAKLQEFPQDMEVEITDGFKWHTYKGDFPIQIFEDVDGTKVVDIGVGEVRSGAGQLSAARR